MDHKLVSIGCVAAYLGWAVAIGIWVVSWIINSEHLGQFAIIVALAAAAATARMWLLDCTGQVENAITIVREVETSASVRPLR